MELFLAFKDLLIFSFAATFFPRKDRKFFADFSATRWRRSIPMFPNDPGKNEAPEKTSSSSSSFFDFLPKKVASKLFFDGRQEGGGDDPDEDEAEGCRSEGDETG